MIRQYAKQLNRLNALSDGVLALGSYAAASWFWLDFVKNSRNMAALRSIRSGMMLTASAYALWNVLVLACFHVYGTRRTHNPGREYRRIVAADAIAILTAAAALYLFRLQDFSRGVLGLHYILSTGLMVLKRVVIRWVLRHMRAKGYNQKHVLVVGGGSLAERYANVVKASPWLGLRIREVFDRVDDTLGERLEARLQGNAIDEVVLALEPGETGAIEDIINLCEKCGTRISVIPFYNDVIPTRPNIDMVGSIKLIQLRTSPLDEPVNRAVKRAFDIVASALGLVVASPVMLVAAVGTKLSSPGPVLFKQVRVGWNKQNFTMYKFRSMRVNARQDSGWSTDADDRRTKFGSLLRKTSIDELPQLFNILKGDMSLVGPRPEVPYYVEQFRETVPLYMVKNQVRPGLTGWAQVHGLRGDTSIPERVKYDLWYIENWTIGLDIDIIFRTLFGGMVNSEKLSL